MAEVTPEVVTPVETPVAEATQLPESTAEQVEPVEPVQTPKTFTQEDVDRVVKKRLQTESKRLERVARAEAEASYLRQQLEARTVTNQPKTDGRPKEEDFAGKPYSEFVEALAEWKAEQKFNAKSQESEQQRFQREQADRAQTMRAKVLEGADEFDDFEQVALADDLPISPAMAAAIAESDVPAKLAYFLGQNRDEAARIFKLAPTQQVRALAKIEGDLSKPPTPTRTPAPIVPASPRPSTEKKLEDAEGYDEFNAIRRKQIAARKR